MHYNSIRIHFEPPLPNRGPNVVLNGQTLRGVMLVNIKKVTKISKLGRKKRRKNV